MTPSNIQKSIQSCVSIVVLTYNSSKYVLETLDSAKKQTYENIELIISDDCSSDNTVEICKNWLERNKDRFIRTILLTVKQNTGISANCNRGVGAVNGEWVKLIAGDDWLYPDCIDVFYAEIKENPQIEILFSNIKVNGILKTDLSNSSAFFGLGVKDQYLKLLQGNILSAPASFLKTSTIVELKGFDERFSAFEDFPFFIKALKAAKKFYYINNPLVYYRVQNEGVSNSKRMNIQYQRSVKLFFKEVLLPELSANKLHLIKLHYHTEYLLLCLTDIGLIKYQRHYEFLLRILSVLFWKKRIEKIAVFFQNIF